VSGQVLIQELVMFYVFWGLIITVSNFSTESLLPDLIGEVNLTDKKQGEVSPDR